MRILIICTGNSCRSQMTEGYLRHKRPVFEVFSAGVRPEKEVNPLAVKVMQEIGIDISFYKPKNIEQFINDEFDYVVTVCDAARESCPVFTGIVKKQLHIGFEDPAAATGSKEEKLIVYRKVRDEIIKEFDEFIDKYLLVSGKY